MSDHVYYKGLTLGPPITLAWTDRDGVLRDFSTGWTFAAKVYLDGAPTALLVNKTAGITGDDISPNVIIDWETADHATLTADRRYNVLLVATPTAGDPVHFPNAIGFTLKTAPA